ncbi:unnamed protein product [Dibothriocephalus latus]|uniref:Uncharacterized protein n=1 Tax=Dibothriocephalus latus TaxID=60516 RepID=A0A3P6USZ2_DIBLA|nr:unnamed protein product [Dibothriocephalus latus]
MQQQVRLMQLLPFAGVTLLCSMSLEYVFSGNRFRTLTIENIVSAVDIFDILECLNVPFTQIDGIIWAPKYRWATSLLHLAVSNMWRDEGIVERPGMPAQMNRSPHSSAVSVNNRMYAFIWSALLQDAYFLPVRINLLLIGLPYNPRILFLAMKNILFLMIAAQRYCVLVCGNL